MAFSVFLFCSCLHSSSSWRGFVTCIGSIMAFSAQEQGRCPPWFTVCSSPAPHSIVRPVAFPLLSQWVRDHRLCPYIPGVRSKADEEPRNAYTLRGLPVQTTNARTSGSQMLTFMPWLGMASMVTLNRSRPFEALLAAPRSVLGAIPPCTV
jgi:hypothetical protein